MFDIDKGPKFLHIDITSTCNLRCIHCRAKAINKPNPKELKTREIIELLDFCKKEFSNWDSLFVGGGEPLVREKDLFDILEHANNLGIKCYLNTNGTLISRQNISKIRRLVEVTQVSLDGVNPKTHDFIRGVEGAFNRAMRGIDLLLKSKARVYIRMTISNLNYLEAFDLLDLALKKGVEAASYYRTLPVGRAKKYNIFIDKKVYNVILRELMRQKYTLKGKLDIVSSDPLKIILDPRIVSKIIKKYDLKKSIGGCLPGVTEIFVNNIGNIYPCTMLPVLLGNIRKDYLKEVWFNSNFLEKLKNRENLKGSCKTCFIKRVCGGCRAAPAGEYNDCFAEDPYCPRSIAEKNKKINKNMVFEEISSPCQSCR